MRKAVLNLVGERTVLPMEVLSTDSMNSEARVAEIVPTEWLDHNIESLEGRPSVGNENS